MSEWVSGVLDRVEANGEPECVGLADDASYGTVGIEAGGVVPAQVVVVDVVGEHVPHRGQNRVFYGDDRFLFPESRCEALVAGTEVGLVLGPGGGHRRGPQSATEPSVAVPGLTGFAFAGGLMGAG